MRALSASTPGAGATVGQALLQASRALQRTGCGSPRLDVEILLAWVLGIDRAQLHLNWNRPLDAETSAAFDHLVQRRCRREPLAYILGQRAFYDILLTVTPQVLIPRPETEQLVELALAWGERWRGKPLKAVDIGTGSGAIALVLARHLPQLQMTTLDFSYEALRVAQVNCHQYGLDERIQLVCCDLLSALNARYDLIIANLPYIPSERLDALQPEVVGFEPRQALDGGADGLDLYGRLVSMLPEHLELRALVLLEIDEGQGEPVTRMLKSVLPGADIAVIRDYAGLERIVRAEIE